MRGELVGSKARQFRRIERMKDGKKWNTPLRRAIFFVIRIEEKQQKQQREIYRIPFSISSQLWPYFYLVNA